ncbi:DUF3017 domain-containing protein [Corynebacterium sp. HS2168-gen11]|uniref:DUF3017 domain-containing protein n=1 Tax=Corynebacterium sp. HS2168-gen11 TaxID=2974027 RepID=UPI00216B1FD9|nr:DUF3017 domain-containing protein [Corynebacterium sp. HS2168-gen11]MCS4535897.1 DUF3017 domain-containing protein [Corynebacterium sp. HS2168-gen11]
MRWSPLDNPHDVNLAPSRIPTALQKAAVGAFVLLVIASGLFAYFEHWRRATFSLGVALVWLAGVRLTCDSRILGVLAVRSRVFDSAYCLGMGALMLFLSASVDSLGS